MVNIDNIPINPVIWSPCFRIIPSRFPPIPVFDRVANESDFEILYEIEQATNPRLRDEIGDISLVHPEERVYGNGSSFIMAAFTHLPIMGTRFSNGSYGVYYAGSTLDTAISETKYHREKFLRDFTCPSIEIDMRVLLADLKADLHDITKLRFDLSHIYDSNNYHFSQEFGRELRQEGLSSFGIKYESVRQQGGECAAVFRPKALSNCRQGKHLCYVWDGEKISYIYQKKIIEHSVVMVSEA